MKIDEVIVPLTKIRTSAITVCQHIYVSKKSIRTYGKSS